MSVLYPEEMLCNPVAFSADLNITVPILKPLETGMCAFLEALLNNLCIVKDESSI